MSPPSASYAFVAMAIEGVGSSESFAPDSQANGWLITTPGTRDFIDRIEAETSWDVKPWLTRGALDIGGASLELWASKVSWPRLAGVLQAEDEAAEKLVARQYRGVTTLESRLLAADTTIDLADSGMDDTTIYIGDETIRLNDETGTSGGVTTYNCVRGQYRSEALAHEAESVVFDRLPYLDTRRIQYYTGHVEPNASSGSDPGVHLERRGQGMIVGGFPQDLGSMPFKTRDGAARLSEVEAGKEDRLLVGPFVAKFSADTGDPFRLSLFTERNSGDEQNLVPPKILKPTLGHVNDGGAIQVGDYVFGADFRVDSSTTPNTADRLRARHLVLWGKDPSFDDLSAEPDEDVETAYEADLTGDEEPYEIFGVDREEGITPAHPIADALGDVFRWHKLTYFAAFVLSTRQTPADPSNFDILTPDWSLNASHLFADGIVGTIKELVRQTPEGFGVTVDRMELGAGNDTVGLWEYCVTILLRPHFHLRIDANGDLTLGRTRTPTIVDHDNAISKPVVPLPSDTLEEDPAEDRVKSAARVEIGGSTLNDPRSLYVRADVNAENRANDYNNGQSIDLDFANVSPDRTVEEVIGMVADTMRAQQFPALRLSFLADDHRFVEADYTLGEWVQLGELDIDPEWVVNKLGVRVDNFEEDRATGLIVARRLHLDEEDRALSYDLTVMFTGDGFTRCRAPSGKIQSSQTVNGGADHELTLGGDGGGDSQYGAVDLLGDPKPDASFFSPGDEIEVRNPDFTEWSNNAIREITDVDANANTITVDGTWSTDPPAGRYVELAHLDSDASGTGYQNDGLNGAFANIDRAYIFLGDTSDTVGTANIEADIYGA